MNVTEVAMMDDIDGVVVNVWKHIGVEEDGDVIGCGGKAGNRCVVHCWRMTKVGETGDIKEVNNRSNLQGQ